MVGPRGEIWPFRRPKTRFSNTLSHHKPQGTSSLTCPKHHTCISFTYTCAPALSSRIDISAPRPLLAVGITFPERQSPGEHICLGSSRAARVPTLERKSQMVKGGTVSNKPTTGAAHGVKARRRRRSWCRRWMSDRAARQHRAGSGPSSCTGRELSA